MISYRLVCDFEEIPDLIPKFKLVFSLGHKRQNTDEIPAVFENLTFPKWVCLYIILCTISRRLRSDTQIKRQNTDEIRGGFCKFVSQSGLVYISSCVQFRGDSRSGTQIQIGVQPRP